MKRRLLTALFMLVAALSLFSRGHQAHAVAGIGPILVAPPASNPGNLANLVTWLRADQAVSPTNGAKFSSIVDLVNGNATYTQSTSANQFVWNASDASFGGKPSMTSTAASYFLTTATLSAQPMTVYGAVKTTTTTTTQILVGNNGDSFEVGAWSAGSLYEYSPVVSGGTNTTATHAVAFVFNGASSAIYIDSSASPVVTGTVTGSPGSLEFSLGYNGGVDGWIGNIAEAMVYSTADSSATVSTVFQYLGARYAQTWH
jgi:hypothetical protein